MEDEPFLSLCNYFGSDVFTVKRPIIHADSLRNACFLQIWINVPEAHQCM